MWIVLHKLLYVIKNPQKLIYLHYVMVLDWDVAISSFAQWKNADTCEGVHQECRSSRLVMCLMLLSSITTKAYAQGGNLNSPRTTRGLFSLSGREVQFPVDALSGLITTLWRKDGCITWQPAATDLFFFPLLLFSFHGWTQKHAALEVQWACWEFECQYINNALFQFNIMGNLLTIQQHAM